MPCPHRSLDPVECSRLATKWGCAQVRYSWLDFTTWQRKRAEREGHLTDCIALAHPLALEVLAAPEHTNLHQAHTGDST